MDSSQDRQLPATAHKLEQARKDGQAPRSRDLAHLAVLGTGAAAVLLLTPVVFERLQMSLGQQLSFDAATLRAPASMLTRMQDMVSVGVLIALTFAIIVGAAAVASAVASGGWIASLKPITPDFSRINPLSGLGNLFSKQQVTNVAKLSLLTAILGFVGYIFLRDSVERISALILQPSALAMRDLGDWLVSGVSLLLLVVFAAAVVDVPLQAFFLRSRLKMSHEEVKQEHKNSEGNPLIKGKLRQRQREVSQRRSISKVPKADFVLMNPTHFAVALRYDEATMDAPQVISKGADLLAMKIREVAKAHNIPVLQSPMLARALYAHAELDQGIPSALYTAVAQVLAYVYRLKAALRGEGAMPADVPDPLVPPELDPLNPAAAKGAAA
ncbi:MAG: EscU/YscU/HrcU family type III secretion system export apparatus switch protein [Pseudomonadota bacterium]